MLDGSNLLIKKVMVSFYTAFRMEIALRSEALHTTYCVFFCFCSKTENEHSTERLALTVILLWQGYRTEASVLLLTVIIHSFNIMRLIFIFMGMVAVVSIVVYTY